MYDIKVLEQQWVAYKKKRMYPIVFMFGFLLIVSGLGYYLLTHLKKDKIESMITANKKEVKKNMKTVLGKIILNKSLETIDIYTIPPNRTTSDEKIDFPVAALEEIPVLKEGTISTEDKGSKNKNKKKKINIFIEESTSVHAYRDVENRFYQSHDIDDALFLARGYFRKKNYKKAEFWALETNKLNSNIEESWIIFVKAKVKLGKRNEALHILRSYIKKSGSQQAKMLLDKLDNKSSAI